MADEQAFDPVAAGAVAVAEPFDPTAHGAVPVQHEEPSIPAKIGHAVVDTLKGFLPQSVEQAALAPITMVPGIGKVGQLLSNVAFGKPIGEGLDPLAGIPVVQRIPQIAAAEKTAPYSQERFTAGIGTLADVAMLAGFKDVFNPKLAETAGIAKPDIAQPVEPVATDTAKTEPIIPEVSPTTTVFRGESKGPSPAGSAHGIGTYYGLDQESAQRFSREGTVKQENVNLENPLVVNSDSELRAIRTDAGVNPDPRVLLSGDEATRFTQYLQNQGHDSFVTNYGEAPGGKQVVVFPKTEPAPAATEATTNVLGKQEPVALDLPTGTGDRFVLNPNGGVFDTIYNQTVTPAATHPDISAGALKALNESDLNGKFINGVTFAADEKGNPILVSDGLSEPIKVSPISGAGAEPTVTSVGRTVGSSPATGATNNPGITIHNGKLYSTPSVPESPVSTTAKTSQEIPTGSGIQETGGATTAPLSTETPHYEIIRNEKTHPEFESIVHSELKSSLSDFPDVYNKISGVDFTRTDVGSGEAFGEIKPKKGDPGHGLELKFGNFYASQHPESELSHLTGTYESGAAATVRHESGHLIWDYIRSRLPDDTAREEFYNFAKQFPKISKYAEKSPLEAVAEVSSKVLSGKGTPEELALWDQLKQRYQAVAPTGKPNAIQEQSAGSILQHPQESVGTSGSVGGTLEPSVQGETPTGTREGGAPQVEATAPEVRPEIPEGAKVTLNIRNTAGELKPREMDAKQAEGMFTKEKESYQALLNCLGA